MALSCLRKGAKEAVVFFRKGKNVSASQRWIAHAPSVSYADTLTFAETEVSALQNKLRVATQSNHRSSTASVGVWIKSGSRNENEQNNGVSHLFEHLAFKSTGRRSEHDIEVEAELHGISLTTHSSRELTWVKAMCLSKDIPKAVELLADVVTHGSLNEIEVERARKVILRELQEADADAGAVMTDYLYSTAYQGTPLGQSPFGTTQSLSSLGTKEVSNFLSSHFKAPQMVLTAAGGVEHQELVKLGEQFFSEESLSSTSDLPLVKRCRFTGSEVRARYDDMPLAHVSIAVEGPRHGHPHSVVMQVAQAVVGSWDRTHVAGKHLSSRLASACSEDELCHSFQSFYSKYSDTGLWGLRFVVDRHGVEDMMYNVQGEWMRMCSSVTEFEVERAKNQLKMDLITRLSTPVSATDALARQVIYNGSVLSLAEIDEEISAVTAEKVRDMCLKYIYDKCPAVSGIGPIEGLPDYNNIRGAMYWLRL